MSTIQEQEEQDYEAGCFANEWQAAFALSQSERRADDKHKIASLVKEGRFVVYHSFADYCRITDAILGELRSYVADFATREEADAEIDSMMADGAEDLCVESPWVADATHDALVASFDSDDDLPF